MGTSARVALSLAQSLCDMAGASRKQTPLDRAGQEA